MHKDLIKTMISVGVVMLAIVLTGVLLDEADRGTFGAWLQAIAKKATNGYATTQV